MRRFIEIMWLGIAAISLVEVFIGYREEGIGSEHFQLFSIIFVTAAFMYFWRKRQRKNLEKTKTGN